MCVKQVGRAFWTMFGLFSVGLSQVSFTLSLVEWFKWIGVFEFNEIVFEFDWVLECGFN